jgi:D-arabinose 1-dehydrogenase-like Zn-dependent alcohol dehydrogenase
MARRSDRSGDNASVRAVMYDEFGRTPELREVTDPQPASHGAVIKVEATGLCRSDWHGWQGHDPDITPPHVPGHEFAGTIAAVGPDVANWRPGRRVTVPFVCGCGECPSCAAGDQQVCERQTQPGFTHWGSFAEYVAIDHADVNLVGLPDDLPFATAASLGCRFATAFRAVVSQGRAGPGEWVAVHGCGGVGLSAVMIALACGARVVAVDVSPEALALAEKLGATPCADPAGVPAVTGGGAHLSIDAFGGQVTAANSITCLRRRGRHVQVGLLPDDPVLPMSRVIAYELTLLGSHGMPAHAYPPMLDLVATGALRPDTLITRTIPLAEAPEALAAMGSTPGVTIIEVTG